ncbi:MAG: hypothetical protein QM800_06870 [Paludibacter sp.]
MSLDLGHEHNFIERLRSHLPGGELPNAPQLQQWLQYWNDEETVAGNLRHLEHWHQRARQTRTVSIAS